MANMFSMFNQLLIRETRAKVKTINQFWKKLQALSDEDLKHIYDTTFSENTANQMFKRVAIIKEIIKRKIGNTLHDEQLMASLLMSDGYIVEMKTGEGKTLSILVVAILRSKIGKMHIVTVNEYLAKRDAEKLKGVYEFFDIKSGYNESLELNKDANKQELLSLDVLYSSSTEIMFDFLRLRNQEKEGSFFIDAVTVIIDEVDFVLIDNALSNCSVSETSNEDKKGVNNKYIIAQRIFNVLEGLEIRKDYKDVNFYSYYDVDYVYMMYNSSFSITQRGLKKIEKLLNIDDITKEDKEMYGIILYVFEANLFYEKGKNYIVKDNKIQLINYENGRLMPNTNLEYNLHTALQFKEGVEVESDFDCENSISYQVFFNRYKFLTGISGTVQEARDEFTEIFAKPIAIIPETKRNIRIDHKDKIFKTFNEKYIELLKLLEADRNIKRPILIVTGSEEESNKVSKLISKYGFNNIILNSQTTKEEEDIVKGAGMEGRITVSTNMAGRGTDIILDEKFLKDKGLLVICLNRYKNRRIDNQVRGRAGRQGQAGESIFLISLEDELWNDCDNNILQSIYKQDLKTFRSKSSQTYMIKLLNELQKEKSETEYKIRLNNYNFDYVINQYRDEYFEAKGLRKLIEDDFKKILNSKYYEIMTIVGSSEFYSLMGEKINSEINELGLAVEIYIKIYKFLAKPLWENIAKDLRYLKMDIFLYERNESLILSKYKVMAYEMFEKYRKGILDKTNENFLTVKLN